MLARSVWSGTRPSAAHSVRACSAPPMRPETITLAPLAPDSITRWTACLIARRTAKRRSICSATRWATSGAERLGFGTSCTLRASWRFGNIFSRSALSRLIVSPPRPITTPGLATCMVTLTLSAARSMSMRAMPAW